MVRSLAGVRVLDLGSPLGEPDRHSRAGQFGPRPRRHRHERPRHQRSVRYSFGGMDRHRPAVAGGCRSREGHALPWPRTEILLSKPGLTQPVAIPAQDQVGLTQEKSRIQSDHTG